MSIGNDMSMFYPQVMKLVIMKSVELKKMVYMYLTQYCDADQTCRELAMMSTNSFRKDVESSNQVFYYFYYLVG